MQISENFRLAELTKSQTAIRLGINNQPNPEQLANMKHLIINLVQPVRNHIKLPMAVNSCLRGEELNERIGGAKNSQHVKGEAIDIEAMGMSNLELGDTIRAHFEFDQLIYEFLEEDDPKAGWIHVSLKREGENRGEVLRADRVDGKTVYTKIDAWR